MKIQRQEKGWGATSGGLYVGDLMGELGQQCTLLLIGGSPLDATEFDCQSSTEAVPSAQQRYAGARVGYTGTRVGYTGTRVGYMGARVANCRPRRLKEMLALSEVTAKARLLVVVRCPLHQTRELFLRVRRHQLESVWTTWVVFAGSYADLMDLQTALNDGIQVLAVVQASEGAVLYQSAAGMDGAISFSKIGKWTQRKHHYHRTDEQMNQAALETPEPEEGVSEGTSRGLSGCEQGSSWGTGALDEPPWTLTLSGPPFLTPQLLRQQDLQGRTLQVPVVDNWPFFGVTYDEGGRLIPASGIDVSVVRTLAKAMNFSIEVVSPPDGEWGKKLPNGSWSGIVGMVTRREVSFAIDEITTTAERGAATALTRSYYLESSTTLTMAPSPSGRALAVFSPFTPTVWLLLTLCILVAGPAFSLLSLTQRRLGLAAEPRPFSLHNTSFNVFKVFFLQRDSAAPSSHALRMLSIFWYLFSFNFFVLYSAKLTAVLASPSYERPIDSLSDLLTAAMGHEVFPVILKGSSIHALFEKADSGVYKDIYQFFTSESYALSRDEGVKKVLERRGALIESTLALEIRAVRRGRHLFHIGREVFFPQSYSVACVTGSKLRVAFDFWLGCMVESGLIDKWKQEQLRELRSDSSDDHEPTISPITLVHLQGAFFVYVLGCGAATLALFGECLFSRLAPALK